MRNSARLILTLIALIPLLAKAQEQQPTLEQRIKILEQRVLEAEAQQSLNIFKFSGQMTSSYDDIAVKEEYPDPKDNTGLNYLRLRFSLDMLADLDPKLKIYTRMTTTKFFNRTNAQGLETRPNDFDAAYRYGPPNVFLEKAYLDYLVNEKFTVSVGKLPTVEGGPSHIWDSQPRQGTYPMMNFNVPLDGVAGTYKFSMPAGYAAFLRLLYTPFTVVNLGGPNDAYLKFPKEDFSGITPMGADIKNIFNLFAVQVEYNFPTRFSETLNSLAVQSTRLPDAPAMTGAGTSNLRYTAQADTLYLRLSKLFDLPLTFVTSFTYTGIDAFGFAAPGVGIGGNTSEAHAYGHSLVMDVRYDLKKWAIGAEYLEVSRNVFSFSTADEDLVRFYRTPGWGQHLYLTRKLTDLVTLRLGYRHKTQTNFNLTAGDVVTTDRDIRNFYVRLRTDF
ncbi:DUF3373 family protein [Bdellovibrio reynosensis]|uniref:DUF3373 family protein n=1 Tax=Bdellovibrio reynosensis TaxID=2835041 RepID=A0ABY4C8Y0_9BACT|nr:DUF3373 family protein [Bdellovibrio reynosensis]UOF01395.1 DUF3373 family protein [Bdellovibrio reynosensis]